MWSWPSWTQKCQTVPFCFPLSCSSFFLSTDISSQNCKGYVKVKSMFDEFASFNGPWSVLSELSLWRLLRFPSPNNSGESRSLSLKFSYPWMCCTDLPGGSKKPAVPKVSKWQEVDAVWALKMATMCQVDPESGTSADTGKSSADAAEAALQVRELVFYNPNRWFKYASNSCSFSNVGRRYSLKTQAQPKLRSLRCRAAWERQIAFQIILHPDLVDSPLRKKSWFFKWAYDIWWSWWIKTLKV